MVASYFLQAAGFTTFLIFQTTASIYVWYVIYGVGMGATITVNTLVRSRYFGRKAFGSIYGTATMFMTPFTIIAPVYAGYMYDTTRSYISVFVLMAVLLALASFLLLFAHPPKPPAVITDIRKIA